MIQLQDSIRDRIQKELNKNTQGLDFEVSLYNVKTNSLLEKQLSIENTYATEQKRFIPVVIEEISGEYADLQNLTAAEVNVNASLLIPTDSNDFNNMAINETFLKVGEALDNFRQTTLARKLPLGEEKYIIGKNYTFDVDYSQAVIIDKLIEFTFKTKDRSEGTILSFSTPSSEYKLLKTKENIRLTLDGDLEESFTYEINEEIKISFQLESGQFKFWYNESFEENPTYTNAEANNLVFCTIGGLFAEAKNFSIYGSNNEKVVDIDNFETLNNKLEFQEVLDKTNAKFVSKSGELGSIVLGFEIPNPTTNQFTFGNGLNYQQFELGMTAFVSDTVFVGNEVKYFLNDIEIFPFYRDESFSSDLDPAQIIQQQVTRFASSQSVLGKEYSVYFKEEQIFVDLMQKITSENLNPNEVFDLKVVYPLFEQEYKVIISQGGLNIVNNQPISISIKLDLADQIFTN